MIKKIIALLFLFLVAVGVFIGALAFRLNSKINTSLQQGWLKAPLEYYTAPEKISKGSKLSPRLLEKKLKQRYYIPFSEGFVNNKSLPSGYFISQAGALCENSENSENSESPENSHLNNNTAPGQKETPSPNSESSKNTNIKSLTAGLSTQEGEQNPKSPKKHCVSWRSLEDTVFSLSFAGDKVDSIQKDGIPLPFIFLKAFLFAQYEKGEPVLKKITPFHKQPFACRRAVLVAEDHQFITHKGVSPKAVLRAFWRNLKAGRLAEGGSTITQQLVKNIFFSQKKSFWRKFQEQITAFLLERKLNKDEILNAYLNMVYMGQSGVFRIHGFASAAEYYTGKPLSQLDLSECALLASIIKSPGRYKPKAGNNKLLERRNYILKKLYEKQMFSEDKLKTFLSKPINFEIKKPAPPIYFTDTVYKKLKSLGLPVHQGLKVFTTLRLDFQDEAEKALSQGLKHLEKTHLKKNEEPLQAVLINVDLAKGAVRSVVGGRDFKKSQFNRAVQAKRQIGSLMKPIVVLSALTEDPELHPLSLLEDTKFNYNYGSRSWSPKNYKNRYRGKVPLYEALTYSLNSATARLGIRAGLKPLTRDIQKLGGPKNLTPHPSLILGALELSPWQTAQIFLNLANMGRHKKQHIITKVTNLKGDILYEHKKDSKPSSSVDKNKAALVVGMLREVARSGTAQRLKNFPRPVAGKTGTTNEEKDSWFAGFTPEFLTVVWVGFDSNKPHHLTGAKGALPLWELFMKKIQPFFSEKDFAYPEGVTKRTVYPEEEEGKKPPKDLAPKKQDAFSLVFER